MKHHETSKHPHQADRHFAEMQASASPHDLGVQGAPENLAASQRTSIQKVLEPGVHVVQLRATSSEYSEMWVHVPTQSPAVRTGAIVLLHGAGSSGRLIAPLAEALCQKTHYYVLCPTAMATTTSNGATADPAKGAAASAPSGATTGATVDAATGATVGGATGTTIGAAAGADTGAGAVAAISGPDAAATIQDTTRSASTSTKPPIESAGQTRTAAPEGAANAALRSPTNNFELGGLLGRRLQHPRWHYGAEDLPMLALRWALRNLSIEADRCVLSGHSMGAVATWNVAARFAHSWAGIAPINGALSLWERIGPDGAAAAMLPNLLDMPVLAVHGSDDQRIPVELEAATIEVLQTLGNANAAQILVEGGDHPLPTMDLTPGAPHFETMASWMVAQRRQPYPRSVSHRALDLDHGRCHWVEILEFAETSGSAAIHAALTPTRQEPWPAPGLSIRRDDGSGGAPPRECQEIVVRTSGVHRLALHLHRHFVEPGDVRIVVNGRSSQHRFTPEVECLLGSHRASADAGLLSEQVLTVDVPDHDEVDSKEGNTEWKWTVDSIF